ncbi:purine-cytosine transporter [Cryobacterium sp. TMT1-62]|uniref:purine-cytosine permease family protein n=1 Tax=unclassified Cryobacterium TaxID=2649013 RepID=UPI000CE30FCD|nr:MULTISPECIES: cytosine permease [unclassified Cryobacterium]TFB60689.1 purine-cytosine transporter [Cryobacterium sp. Hz7]TFD36320.1 purine-cytosine transporter [Cryobacterium sp. TMT1-62]
MSLYTRLDRRLDTNSDDAGPVRGTYSLGRVLMIWLAANLVVTTLLTGTLFVPDVPFGLVIALIVGGTIVGAAVLVTVGAIGTRTGLPTMAITRGPFGTRGSLLPVAANVVILMGWSWVQAMLAGIALNYIVASMTGFSNPVIFAVLCQTIVVILAIFGHAGVARVEPWFAAVILAIAAYIFVVAFSTFPPAEFAAIPATLEPFYSPGLAFDVVVATAISWTVLSADFNRFASTTRAGVVGSGIGYTLSTVISMTLGASAIGYVVLRGGDAMAFDPVTIIEPFGALFAVAIFLSVMATNTMVVYGMVTSVVNALPGRRVKFLPTAIVLGLISIIGSTFFGLLAQFTTFLVTIGALFAPIFAIMIVDYYIVARGSYSADILKAQGGRYWYTGGINWLAVASWVVGAVSAYVWAYVWPLPFGATVPAFLLTFAVYLAFSLARRSRTPFEPSQHLADADTSR